MHWCSAKRIIFLFFICLLGTLCLLFSSSSTTSATDSEADRIVPSENIRFSKKLPEKHLIIGVTTQPIPRTENTSLPIGMIDATYVDLLSSYNISVIPIYHHLSQASLKALLDRLDGVLLPGGSTAILRYNHTDDQGSKKATDFSILGKFLKSLIYQAVDINKINSTFPLYGICLGNEALGMSFSDNLDVLQDIVRWNKDDQLAPIKFVADQQNSKIMSSLPSLLKSKMESSESQNFHHHHSISYPAALNNSQFMEEFTIVATARDIHDLEYAAIIESKHHPFFGTQFHTNRIQVSKNIDTQKEIQTFFFHYFLNLAKNRQRFRGNDLKFIEMFGLSSDQKTKISNYPSEVYVVDFNDFPSKNNIQR